jgi:MraZ protein
MFLGSYRPSFDLKSRRIALPKKVRDYLATNDIILSYGFEKCIFGFDTKDWESQSTKQLEEPISLRGARDLRRFFFSSATSCELDSQGRFVIPGNLLEYAKITSPVIIGAGDHFEIWQQSTWDRLKTNLEEGMK